MSGAVVSAFAGYVAVTVAVLPADAPWQAQASKCVESIWRPATDAPLTVMSKSAIVTRDPFALRGTSLLDGSRIVSWTAAQKPIGSGFIVGVTVTVHGPCACAMVAARRQAASGTPTPRRQRARNALDTSCAELILESPRSRSGKARAYLARRKRVEKRRDGSPVTCRSIPPAFWCMYWLLRHGLVRIMGSRYVR
jgi:hypothetical protein